MRREKRRCVRKRAGRSRAERSETGGRNAPQKRNALRRAGRRRRSRSDAQAPAFDASGQREHAYPKEAMFRACACLEQDVALEQIVETELPQKEELVVSATGRSLEAINESGGIKAVLKSERYARFSTMLHEKFPLATIRKLLEIVEDRSKDAEVQNLVTDNADLPTIFEYLVGLAWYYVSGETGDVLEYMNLSLSPDLLPKTHAGGGEADIVWPYEANPPYYDKHTLFIEVTLAGKDAQRRMEMEPVSRHLGQYLLSHPDDRQAYCAFVTTYLDLNVISDFRGRKRQTFYNPNDCAQRVEGMKIVPLDTKCCGKSWNAVCDTQPSTAHSTISTAARVILSLAMTTCARQLRADE